MVQPLTAPLAKRGGTLYTACLLPDDWGGEYRWSALSIFQPFAGLVEQQHVSV
jgi:hypothetical protein